MSKTPFFTVVVPSYNRADLILETLETVFQQEFQNFEIIVVDNCSTDNTVEVLKPLQEQGKIKLIVNEKNLERSRSRNVGFEAANGEFLTLLDSDDFMYPNNLKKAYEFIQREAEAKFIHNYYELVDQSRKPIYQYDFPKKKDQIKQLARGNFLSCIGVFLAKEIYQNFKFNEDENVLGSEDWEMWIRIRASYPLHVIPEILSAIREHPGRSIGSYSVDSVIERKYYIIDQLMKNDSVKRVFGPYENEMRASANVFTAIMANDAKQFSVARKYLKRALKINGSLLFNFHFWRVCRKSLFG